MPKLLALCAFLIALAGVGAGCNRSSETTDGTGSTATPQGSGAAAETPAPPSPTQSLVVYSGRSEALVGPALSAFQTASGIELRVNYGDTPLLAATLLEEGDATPADVFIAQDASTLALLEAQGALASLPEAVLERVPPTFRSRTGQWVGTTGRARVLAYNTERVAADALPADIGALTAPAWNGRVGWAPENASFQAFVGAMLQLDGEEATRAWLAAMQANAPREYPNNTAAVHAVGRGEVDVALTNHYYLFRLRAEHGEGFPVENHYFRDGGAASLVNVSGVALTAHTEHRDAAIALVEYLLSDEAQRQFAQANHEFPTTAGIAAHEALPPIETLGAPVVDLAALDDLAETQRLLREVGALR